MKKVGNDFIIITLCVDDILLITNSSKMVSVVKYLLAIQFDMKDIGSINYFWACK